MAGEYVRPDGPPDLSPFAGLPTRADFARRDAKLHGGVGRMLAAGELIHFMPSDVYEDNEFVRGQLTYRLFLYGALLDGSKALLVVEDVPVYFDVWVPAGQEATAMIPLLSSFGKAAPLATEIGAAFPLKMFRREAAPKVRLFYRTLADRRAALSAIQGASYTAADGEQRKYETASDDRTYFHLVGRRWRLPFAGWLEARRFRWRRGEAGAPGPGTPEPRTPHCEHVMRVSIEDLASVADPLDRSDANSKKAELLARANFARDRTLVMTLDIETYSPDRSRIAAPEHAEDVIFMLCATAHWRSEAEPLSQVCLTTCASAESADWLTVLCRAGAGMPRPNNSAQASLLTAFARLVRAWAPDAITGFNDFGFDWPFLVEKARQADLLNDFEQLMSARPWSHISGGDFMARRWQTHRFVKISAERMHEIKYPKFPGWLPVDSRVCFMRLYPKAEKTSLAWFLNKCRLGGKADMPYLEMFRRYERSRAAATPEAAVAAAAEMRDVAGYCIIDARRCQELLVARNVLANRREMANFSFTTLMGSLFHADGGRVLNMVGAYGEQDNVLITSQRNDVLLEGKYPGAYVVQPIKGLEEDLPVTGLDFSSLYPALIQAYNLSPDRALESEAAARELELAGEQIHRVEFEFGARTVRGWFVRHGNDPAKRGLYCRALAELKLTRNALKAKLGRFERILELAEKFLGDWQASGTLFLAAAEAAIAAETNGFTEMLSKHCAAAKEPLHAFESELELMAFERDSLDAKQKAVKVFMNTFYGVAGQSTSPLFMLELAGGITSAGKANLMLAIRFVEAAGFGVKYGDTDSAYLTCPPDVYAEAEAAYREAIAGLPDTPEALAAPYLALCESKVLTTMRVMADIQKRVNAHLAADNGTNILKMAYEEVLFPVVLTGKKKYFGVPHMEVVNFNIPDASKLFVRGIDVVKQGQTELTRKIGYRCMWEATRLRPPGHRPGLQTIVERVLEKACRDFGTPDSEWALEDFIKSAAWKPNKDNKSVQRFMARMRLRHEEQQAENSAALAAGRSAAGLLYEEPEAGDRFSYLLVEVANSVDLRGYRRPIKTGDKMEYVQAVKALGLKVDVRYYLIHYAVGLCARFINFAFPAAGEDDDAASQKAAVKHLTAFVGGLVESQAATGADLRRFKKIFRGVAAEAADALGDAASVFAPGPRGGGYELLLGEQAAADLSERADLIALQLDPVPADFAAMACNLGASLAEARSQAAQAAGRADFRRRLADIEHAARGTLERACAAARPSALRLDAAIQAAVGRARAGSAPALDFAPRPEDLAAAAAIEAALLDLGAALAARRWDRALAAGLATL